MSNEPWLRDALRAAAASQPVVGDRRAIGALRLAAVRRKQRLAMASFSAVLAMFVATSLTGGNETRGLEPVSPTATPSASESPLAEESPSASPVPGGGVESPEPARETPTEGPRPDVRPAPDSPVAIDVYFVVDMTSGLQGWQADRLIQDVVRGLRAGGDDVHYGYGATGDIRPGLSITDTYTYRLLYQIGPHPRGPFYAEYIPGGDEPDGQTFGLKGATGWYDGTHVANSQPAGYRADARKLLVLITDAPMHSGGEYPTIADAAATLRAHGIRAASLLLHSNSDYERVRRDLQRVATGTGARAAGKVDCEGDGFDPGIDPGHGDPLICESFVGNDDADHAGFGKGLLRLALS